MIHNRESWYTIRVQRKRITIILALAAALLLAAAASYYLYYHRDAYTPPIYHRTAPAPGAASATPPPAFDKKQYSTTDPTSPWVVVNKQHPINPINYAPSDLTSVGNGQQMRAEAASALQHMFSDAQAAGYTLVADSGYRSYSTQVSTYNGYVQQWGQTYTDTVSARPGYSEHQTGWAVDIGTENCHVADCFGDTAGGKWAAANAYKYGFLLRYPSDLTDITGYSNETWHFRYIGPTLAEQLHKENVLTLEQFFDIPGGTTYK